MFNTAVVCPEEQTFRRNKLCEKLKVLKLSEHSENVCRRRKILNIQEQSRHKAELGRCRFLPQEDGDTVKNNKHEELLKKQKRAEEIKKRKMKLEKEREAQLKLEMEIKDQRQQMKKKVRAIPKPKISTMKIREAMISQKQEEAESICIFKELKAEHRLREIKSVHKRKILENHEVNNKKQEVASKIRADLEKLEKETLKSDIAMKEERTNQVLGIEEKPKLKPIKYKRCKSTKPDAAAYKKPKSEVWSTYDLYPFYLDSEEMADFIPVPPICYDDQDTQCGFPEETELQQFSDGQVQTEVNQTETVDVAQQVELIPAVRGRIASWDIRERQEEILNLRVLDNFEKK